MADVFTLDGQKISGRGVVVGSSFRVPRLEETAFRFGSRGGGGGGGGGEGGGQVRRPGWEAAAGGRGTCGHALKGMFGGAAAPPLGQALAAEATSPAAAVAGRRPRAAGRRRGWMNGRWVARAAPWRRPRLPACLPVPFERGPDAAPQSQGGALPPEKEEAWQALVAALEQKEAAEAAAGEAAAGPGAGDGGGAQQGEEDEGALRQRLAELNEKIKRQQQQQEQEQQQAGRAGGGGGRGGKRGSGAADAPPEEEAAEEASGAQGDKGGKRRRTGR
jgi:hypothetical protein